jgi:hypothetical protein
MSRIFTLFTHCYGVCAFQNQVHRRAAEIAERGFLLIQSGLRRAVAASAAQAGDRDWIKNSLPVGRPAGRRSKPLDGRGTYYEACIEKMETFLFGSISRQTKNAFSASSAPGLLLSSLFLKIFS